VADIFLSYSSADRPRAMALAHALEGLGFDVWWDREIPLGRPYSQVIPEELAKARCVLVLWSPQSAQSHWVYEEAVKGRDRGVLIPALIEPTELPMGFGLLQAADLTDWEPGEAHAGFDDLVDNVRAKLGAPPVVRPRPRPQPGTRKAVRKALWLGVPAAAVAVVALVLTTVHVPTRVKLDLAVDRLTFTVGGEERVPLLEAVDFLSLTVEHLQALQFDPTWLAIADPARYDDELDRYADDAWQVLMPAGPVTMRPASEQLRASASIESLHGDPIAAGQLGAVSVAPGSRLTLQTTAGQTPRVAVSIDGEETRLIVTPHGRFVLIGNHLSAGTTLDLPYAADAVEMRVQLRARRPVAVIAGEPQTIALTLRLAQRELEFLTSGGTPVTAVEFLRPRPDAPERGFEPSLVAEATLAYPDVAGMASVKIGSDEFVGLRGLAQCSIQSLALEPDPAALRVRLDCKASSIRVRSGDFVTERALSAMERLWHSSRLAVLVPLIAAVLSMTVSAYQLLRSLRESN
jgi:hypothetical protein